MRVYEVPRTKGAPDWSVIPAASVDQVLWRPDCGIRARAQLAYHSRKLYVRLEATEAEPVARLSGPCEAVANDSCLEFFFCPRPKDDCYFNFEWNPLGTLYLGFGRNMREHARQLIQEPKRLFAAKPFQTEGGWGITFEIPATFIRRYAPEFRLREETILRGNFYKCGDCTPKPHYLAWNPVVSAAPDFHRPDQFGMIKLMPGTEE